MSSVNPPQRDVDPPAIGGLLRLAWESHRVRLYDAVAVDEFADVTPAQFELFRWPGIDGLRPGEVARLTRLSKQTINDLLGELERSGYLERHRHPADRRARVVRLTPKGHRLQRTTHETSRALEASWAASVGEDRFAALRSTLEEMVEHGLPDGPRERHGVD